jgi:hypothetical protein
MVGVFVSQDKRKESTHVRTMIGVFICHGKVRKSMHMAEIHKILYLVPHPQKFHELYAPSSRINSYKQI